MNVETILAKKGHEVATARPDDVTNDAVRRMAAERVGALVISEDGLRITGILSERDVLRRIAEDGPSVLDEPVRALMTEKVFVCSPGDGVSAIMGLMTERRIRHVPVVGGDGRLCGIISIGDVVKHRLGEIQEEAEAMREYIHGNV